MQQQDDEDSERQQRKQLRLHRAIQRIEAELEPREEHVSSTSARTASSTPPQPPFQHHVISKSHDRLERRRASSLRLISGHIAATDKKENARRVLNQHRTKERHQARHRCETKCRAMEEEISSGWEACGAQTSAWATKEALEKQQERCEALIKAKEDLIQDFTFYRRLADDDHQSSLLDHNENMNALKESIGSELMEVQEMLKEELETIEEAFVDDRTKLLESNRDEIANLILEKSNLQLHHIQSSLARRDGNHGDIHAERSNARTEYARLKTSLEDQIHELEEKLEKAKSSHAMNGSKLDYNLRILSERKEEAAAIIKKQKKRLVRSKAKFNESRDRYWEAEKRADRQIATLSKDCKALDSRNQGLRTKFRRFETNDKGKYHALLDMHIEELSMLAKKIQRCAGAIAMQLVDDGRHQPEPQIFGTEIYGEEDKEAQLAKLNNIIDEATYQGWVELETKLEAYKDILDQRSQKNNMILRISGNSHEVELQTQEIAESDDAKDLICPPTMFLQATKIR